MGDTLRGNKAHLTGVSAAAVGHDARRMPTQVQRTAAARRRLIAATRELVAAQGVGNTSVAAIGELAGMSRGAVNFHFGSKDDLLVAVTEEVTSDWENPGRGRCRGGARQRRCARDELLGAWLGELHSQPERVRIVVMLLFEALGPSPHLHHHFLGLGRGCGRVSPGTSLRARRPARLPPPSTRTGSDALPRRALCGVAVANLLDPAASTSTPRSPKRARPSWRDSPRLTRRRPAPGAAARRYGSKRWSPRARCPATLPAHGGGVNDARWRSARVPPDDPAVLAR